MAEQQKPSEILQKIRQMDGPTLTAVYKDAYPMVEKYILDNSGSKDDAEDIFQDAMYILIKKVSDSHFELSSKISTFLFGIGKHLWLKKLTKKKVNLKSYQKEISDDAIEEEETDQLEQTQRMKQCIDALGEPCKTIIVQFYFMQTSMQEIAEMLNYTNANNAKNQKYKCFMRLKKLMTGNQDDE